MESYLLIVFDNENMVLTGSTGEPGRPGASGGAGPVGPKGKVKVEL